jgi:hypothetical protein
MGGVSVSHPQTDAVGAEPDGIASPVARRLVRRRWRDPRLWFGMLLVATAVAAGAGVVVSADDTVEVWQVTTDLPAGSPVGASEVEATGVHFDDEADLAPYLRADAPLPAGAVLRSDVAAGQLLARTDLTRGAASGAAELPLAVDEGGLPGDLAAGDRVQVWAVPEDPRDHSTPRRLVDDVRVVAVESAGPVGPGTATGVVVAMPADADIAAVLAGLRDASVVLVRLGS